MAAGTSPSPRLPDPPRMRPAALRPPGRPSSRVALGLGAAAVAGGALSGCSFLREEGFSQSRNGDPVVRSFDEAELCLRPDEVADDLLIGPGAAYAGGVPLPGGANGVSHVGCGPAGCGPGAPAGCAAGGPAVEAVRCCAAGAAAERGNRPDLAVGEYRRALMHDPACPAAHHRLAVLLDGAGQYPAAEQHYAAALTARPHDADLLCDAGYSLLLQNRLPEAETRLRTALAKTPDHARSLENLALLAARRGDRAAAEAALLATNAPGVGEKLALLFPAAAEPTAVPAEQVVPAVAPSPVRVAAAVAEPAGRTVTPAAASEPGPTGLPLWGGTPDPPVETMLPVPAAAPEAEPTRSTDALPLWPPVGGFTAPR